MLLNFFGRRLALVILSVVTFGTVAYAYDFDFTNTMEGPVRVRIKMSGINEPWYYATLQGKNMRMGRNYTFAFRIGSELDLGDGTKEYVGRKVGFCLSQIQVAPFEKVVKDTVEKDEETPLTPIKKSDDAIVEDDSTGDDESVSSKEEVAGAVEWEETDEWYDLSPQFVETNYFVKMLQAAGQVADGFTDAAGKTMEAIESSLTTETGGTKIGGKQVSELTLSKIVTAIGTIIGTTLCKDRSFTIVPNITIDGKKAPGFLLLTNER